LGLKESWLPLMPLGTRFRAKGVNVQGYCPAMLPSLTA